ncbi:hypothetical protein BKA82DRAFT_18087 [Pisolithus tinctorius]|uniref:Uncharacterized protein n=1 Tax=Pisolithus tinctorius Marx 270 TaxID=870435 RepID=A0A0C3KW80_PISTI|nr:hypothetical protein BKA82DRAFT_18087 [Pisolithus tinctorius]KIO13817.1 hypothetical protein M404DRAFT_18087 [Pisolithus tinctorius Marx 270]
MVYITTNRPLGASVHLDRGSLYVCTVPLLSGKFHWSLIHITETGVATRHHWAAVGANPQGRETYVKQTLPRGPLTASATQILGYFKVTAYRTGNGVVRDPDGFWEVCKSVFPQSYPTAEENRQHNISCRTWVTNVLQGLGIERAQALKVEQAVTSRSQACETRYLRSYLNSEPYQIVIDEI